MTDIIIKVAGKVVYEGPSGDVDVKAKKSGPALKDFFGSFSSHTSSVTINGQTVVSGSHMGVPPLVIQGNVTGNVRTDGSVQANNVGGNVDAGGSCQCDDVAGSVNAGGSIQAGDIQGSARAGGSIVADRVGR